MNNKTIVFDREAKEKLYSGIEKLVKAVVCTLGPNGRNVIIEKEQGNPHATKDGVTVAKSIQLKDPIENIGAQVVKQASIKTAEQAGDGTTTSTALAGTLISLGLTAIRAGINAVEVKKGMEYAVKQVVKELRANSKEITDENELTQVATISANNDEEIGNLVSIAMEKVGRDGIITVEQSRSGETSLEIVEGLQFERGYKSPYFVTDNNTMQAILEEVYVLIYDKRLTTIKEIVPILNQISQIDKSLLIIAEDIDGEALSTLVMNKARGTIKVCAVKAPDFGDRRLSILEDIAILTGGTLISKDRGMNLEKIDLTYLGKARIATIGKDTTTIIDGKGDADTIKDRILSIKTLIDKSNSSYEIETLQNRLGKMVGGVAVINVGGANEIEILEKKDRLDDALQATRAAQEEGILPGSGTALIAARNVLLKINELSRDQMIGVDIVYRSLSTPFKQILENAGIDSAEFLYCSLLTKTAAFNVQTIAFVEAYESGIIDPTKVIRCALENAVAVAGTILTTECVVYTDSEETKEPEPQF